MNIHKIYNWIFKIWRVRRHALFINTINPTRQTRILDVGGYPATWTKFEPCAQSILCLNIHSIDWNPNQSPHYNISVALGDARDMKHIDNKAYDVVFSNSVIEHVGEWTDQQAFAAEVRRVGGKLWIQTPAKECPIEPHYLALFIHWLPKGWQKKLIRWCSVYGWTQQPSQSVIDPLVTSIRLLTKKEFKTLFPDCLILVETLWGIIPKSYIAFRTN